MTDPTPASAALRELESLIAARKRPDGKWKALGDPELAYAAARAVAALSSAETRAHGLRELIGTCREKAQRLSALAEKRDLSGLSQTAEIDRAEASHLRWFADELDAALSASSPPAPQAVSIQGPTGIEFDTSALKSWTGRLRIYSTAPIEIIPVTTNEDATRTGETLPDPPGRATAPTDEASPSHRWNIEPQADGSVYVCRGGHHRSADCEWERFVPASRRGDEPSSLPMSGQPGDAARNAAKIPEGTAEATPAPPDQSECSYHSRFDGTCARGTFRCPNHHPYQKTGAEGGAPPPLPSDADPKVRAAMRPADFTPDGWTLTVFGQHRDGCKAGPFATKRHSSCDCGLSEAIYELNARPLPVPSLSGETRTTTKTEEAP